MTKEDGTLVLIFQNDGTQWFQGCFAPEVD